MEMTVWKTKEKLKEKEGGTVFPIVMLFLMGMLLFSIIFEFVRIKIVASGIKDAYENAVRTVAVENYNETYAGFREEVSVGGQYIGGPEGGGEEEIPEWESLHDLGDVEDELSTLLGLREENGILISEESGYELSEFEVQVKDAQDSVLRKYEIKGNLKLKIPFAIGGIAASQVTIPVTIQTEYSEKY